MRPSTLILTTTIPFLSILLITTATTQLTSTRTHTSPHSARTSLLAPAVTVAVGEAVEGGV